MKRAEADRRIEALVEFQDAVSRVLSVTGTRRDDLGRVFLTPEPGRESEWHVAKAEVDRLSMKAARSFEAAGVVMQWETPGTHPATSMRINPASSWSTIFDVYGHFTPTELDAFINMAIGALQDLRDDPPRRQRTFDWSRLTPVGKWVAGIASAVAAGLIVAGLAYWFGWVG